MPRSLRLGSAAVLIAVVAFGAGYFTAHDTARVVTLPEVEGIIWPPPPPFEHFELVDTAGRVFDEFRLGDKWTLLFFGYTRCPDICPTTLATLKGVDSALSALEAFAVRGQVVFVSVDPERDSPAVLRQYTDHFDPDFVAASALPEALHLLTRQLGARIVRVSTDDASEYWFDHPATILLIGPDRRLIGAFDPPHEIENIARQVRAIIEYTEAGA